MVGNPSYVLQPGVFLARPFFWHVRLVTKHVVRVFWTKSMPNPIQKFTMSPMPNPIAYNGGMDKKSRGRLRRPLCNGLSFCMFSLGCPKVSSPTVNTTTDIHNITWFEWFGKFLRFFFVVVPRWYCWQCRRRNSFCGERCDVCCPLRTHFGRVVQDRCCMLNDNWGDSRLGQ